MTIGFKFGHQVIESYRRLSYTPWHALAEFVDNSTQAYEDHKDELDRIFSDRAERLNVRIAYSKEDDLIRIYDNASGTSYDELERALEVSRPPQNTRGRSRYGLGMKTASCWLGDQWTIRTKRLGEEVEHFVEINVPRISQGHVDLPYTKAEGRAKHEHYTVIEITKLHHSFHGRTLGKIKDFLRSIYRRDISSRVLNLEFRGEMLEWDDLEQKLLQLPDGQRYRRQFLFQIDGREVSGWVGILAKGSRANAGFSILQAGRVIRGWPDSWRPTSLYGQLQGSNDLVNQRLVGEINLDDFLVSHTKDDILWQGTEEEEVNEQLAKHCVDYREIALKRRITKEDERGPSEADTSLAIDELKRELESPEMIDQINIEPVPTAEIVAASKRKVTAEVRVREATFETNISGIGVQIYIQDDMSPNDSYVYVEASERSKVMVVVNQAHPHWSQLGDSQDILNYLRHCVFDGLAEWKARQKAATIDPDTIRTLKDGFLRVPMIIEEHQVKAVAEAEGPEAGRDG